MESKLTRACFPGLGVVLSSKLPDAPDDDDAPIRPTASALPYSTRAAARDRLS